MSKLGIITSSQSKKLEEENLIYHGVLYDSGSGELFARLHSLPLPRYLKGHSSATIAIKEYKQQIIKKGTVQ